MKKVRERAFIVGVNLARNPVEFQESLEELKSLVEVAGAEVAARFSQKRQKPDLTYYVGKGKLAEIKDRKAQLKPDVIVFDHELTPAQAKNLEDMFKCKVIDRSEVILDIFARRARTVQARLAVELAQLEYQLPRLTRLWGHLSRIEGGIGTRGPGEKQLETDRRLARKQIQRYKAKLEKIENRIERDVKSRRGEYTVALVGYTNAGKSTLMRHFSGKDVTVKDELFATIDTRTARVELGNNNTILLSDTVGFISNIPHDLIESFKATLMHARSADILVHVVDCSSPILESRIRTVDKLLTEIGCGDIQTIRVFNKIDAAADPVYVNTLADRYKHAAIISAVKGSNMDRLEELLRGLVAVSRRRLHIEIPIGLGQKIAEVNRIAEIHTSDYSDQSVTMEITAPSEYADRLRGEGFVLEGEGLMG